MSTSVPLDVGPAVRNSRHGHRARLSSDSRRSANRCHSRRVAAFDPCFAQKRVARRASASRPASRPPAIPHDHRTRFQPRANRAPRGGNRWRSDPLTRSPPFARRASIAGLGARRWAVRSPRNDRRAVSGALRPAQPVELQPLHHAPVRAGHEVTALVAASNSRSIRLSPGSSASRP